MEKPTEFSTRTITEGAVVALVQGKIDRLREKCEEFTASRFKSGKGWKEQEARIAQIGALETVIGGLRWCPDAAIDPDNAGGNFPICDGEDA